MKSSEDILKSKLEQLTTRLAGGNKAEFARILGVTNKQLHRWLTSPGGPNLKSLDRIAIQLGLHPSQLISDEELPEIVSHEPTETEIVARIKKAFEAEKRLKIIERVSQMTHRK